MPLSSYTEAVRGQPAESAGLVGIGDKLISSNEVLLVGFSLRTVTALLRQQIKEKPREPLRLRFRRHTGSTTLVSRGNGKEAPKKQKPSGDFPVSSGFQAHGQLGVQKADPPLHPYAYLQPNYGYWAAPLSRHEVNMFYQPPVSSPASKYRTMMCESTPPSEPINITRPDAVSLSKKKSSGAKNISSKLSPRKRKSPKESIAVSSRAFRTERNPDQLFCATLPPHTKPGDQFEVVGPKDNQKYGLTCPDTLTTAEVSSDNARFLCVVQPHPPASHDLSSPQLSTTSLRRSRREMKGVSGGYSVMSRSPGKVWREFSKSSSRQGMEYQVTELPSCKNWDQRNIPSDDAAPR